MSVVMRKAYAPPALEKRGRLVSVVLTFIVETPIQMYRRLEKKREWKSELRKVLRPVASGRPGAYEILPLAENGQRCNRA